MFGSLHPLNGCAPVATVADTLMKKIDLVRKLSKHAGLSPAEARRAIDELFSGENGIITQALQSGEPVSIKGFGRFETKRRKARLGRNPRTGKHISIPPAKYATFKVGKDLKDILSSGTGTSSGGPGRKGI
jgi:DNA-binding protein HU-beta